MSGFLGIDPGVTGGLALLDGDHIEAVDIPNVDGVVDVDLLARIIRDWSPEFAVIERVAALAKAGASASFRFGAAYGALRATVAVCNIPHQLVTAQKWKGYFSLDSDKEKSRARAIQLWPGRGLFERKKDHGRAEAALIALYGANVLAPVVLRRTG